MIYVTDLESEDALRVPWPGWFYPSGRAKVSRNAMCWETTPTTRRSSASGGPTKHRPELYRLVKTKERVLAISRVTQRSTAAWLPASIVFSEQLVVFPEDRDAFFTVMQSLVHEIWARFFASSLENSLRYTPTGPGRDLPRPLGWETSAALEDIGKRCDARIAQGSCRYDRHGVEGSRRRATAFDPVERRSPAIATLRAPLRAEMDRAVLDACRWSDLRPAYDFRVQLDERVRLTQDDDTRDEVLARLLEENRRRAEAMKARGGGGSAREGEGEGAGRAGRGERHAGAAGGGVTAGAP
ncbi:MAG: hypothetical protein U0325_25220 [Polyangiales bacterium]